MRTEPAARTTLRCRQHPNCRIKVEVHLETYERSYDSVGLNLGGYLNTVASIYADFQRFDSGFPKRSDEIESLDTSSNPWSPTTVLPARSPDLSTRKTQVSPKCFLHPISKRKFS